MPSIKINVKPTAGGDKFSVDIETSVTIRELKEAVAGKCTISADEQRLIYKGQVLKDERNIDSYGIQNEHVLHMVKGKSQGGASSASTSASSAAASSAPSTTGANAAPMGGAGDLGLGGLGLGNPEQMQQIMGQMMNSPMMQNVMNDPEVLRNMLQGNPAIQQLMDRNPEFAQLLNNPGQLQEAMQAASNPALMREQMRNQDRTMANIESHPEGFNALRRMYENFQEPLMNATAGGGGGGNQQDPLAALLGAAQTASSAQAAAGSNTASNANTDSTAAGTPNTAPLPNPWAPGGGAAGGGAAPAGLGGLGLGAAGGGLAGLEGLGGLGGMGQGGQPDMGAMLQMLQNPGVQQAVQGIMAQPQLMQAMMAANPQMQAMMNQNPQMREMMNNPEALRAAMNPDNLQAVMQMQQAMQRLQGTGLVPQGGAMPGMGGAGGFDLSALLGGGGGGFGGAAAQPPADPESAYASQLTQLQDMGFIDRAENIRALQAVNGNVNAAVERLLSGL